MSRPINKLFMDGNGNFSEKKYKSWYNKKYPERYKQYWMKYSKVHGAERLIKEKARQQRIKTEILGFYSGGKAGCKRCGETDIRVLSIDHIKNNGSEHRKKLSAARKGGATFYMWIKRNNYPKEYQVLCMNCQFIKRYEKT